MKHRSFLGHLVALRFTLEGMREYVRENRDSFLQTARAGTMDKADRNIAKIQGHMANLDCELNSVTYENIRRIRPSR
jgi:hypothetical protein